MAPATERVQGQPQEHETLAHKEEVGERTRRREEQEADEAQPRNKVPTFWTHLVSSLPQSKEKQEDVLLSLTKQLDRSEPSPALWVSFPIYTTRGKN